MKGFGNQKNSKNIKKNSNKDNHKKQIINQAIQLQSKGKNIEAAKFYQQIINQGCNDQRVFLNYGVILKKFGKLKEAEFSIRKAIEINPDYALAHSNLGTVLKDLGKLKEAEFATRKAIEINPDYALAHSNLGTILKDLGKLKEAEFATRKAIEINPGIAEAYSNLGTILKNLGNLNEAEFATRKAIEINPNYALAHSNLGSILKNIGNLKEAELAFCKAIEIKPYLASAYFSLSTLNYSKKSKIWEKLFSENILKNNLDKDKINIYFARGNILHNKKIYEESSKYYNLANKLKLEIKPSQLEYRIKKSKKLFIETNKLEINKKEYINYPKCIFIVGMPRSGSTLLESILSMNNDVYDLGEINILEESYLQKKQIDQKSLLFDIYIERLSKIINKPKIITNKWLYNYQYTGIISRQIPNAKIIHCYRNPLDNILSIYRANFESGNEYSSSLIDCTRIYLDQEEIMCKYKNRFGSKIYDLNYDSLVCDPNNEIKSLISWLGWQWDDSYLFPHLNPRPVTTASSVQVRSPINSRSSGGWKNYKDMLKPSIEILLQSDKYRDLLS